MVIRPTCNVLQAEVCSSFSCNKGTSIVFDVENSCSFHDFIVAWCNIVLLPLNHLHLQLALTSPRPLESKEITIYTFKYTPCKILASSFILQERISKPLQALVSWRECILNSILWLGQVLIQAPFVSLVIGRKKNEGHEEIHTRVEKERNIATMEAPSFSCFGEFLYQWWSWRRNNYPLMRIESP